MTSKHTHEEDIQKKLQEFQEHFQPDNGTQSLRSIVSQAIEGGYSNIFQHQNSHRMNHNPAE